jgi:N-dimethylarginine dimethylaminohydrolase
MMNPGSPNTSDLHCGYLSLARIKRPRVSAQSHSAEAAASHFIYPVILNSMAKKILMCPPTYFDIEYEINVWMSEANQPSEETAQDQWDKLYKIYTEQLGWEVQLIEPVEHLPDMVFATDCCLMINGRALLSSFRFPQRQAETQHFEKWLRENGYNNLKKADNLFEGGGDNMLAGDKIIAGHGFRSSAEAAQEMEEYFGLEVISLKIVDPRFYHLDTSLAVLSPDTIAYYPAAIDSASQERLKAAIPNLIEATLEEAQGFGLNAVSDGHTIITSNENESLLQKYRQAGFEVIGTPILEFRKSGGGVKCLTLDLTK